MTSHVSSVVFFSSHPEELVQVLSALDLGLLHEVHDDGIEHWACELDDVHIAVYRADDAGSAPRFGAGGSTLFGVYIDDLDAAADRLRQMDATITTTHQHRPWGCRLIVEAMDGRSIEVNQRDHCDGAGVC